MVMRQGVATDLVRKLKDDWDENKARIDRVDRWYRGINEKPWMPRLSTREYRELQERAPTPWLSLVVTAVAQALYVEGFRRADDPENSSSWEVWQANGWDARQTAVHRGALAHGTAYATVLPGMLNGEPMPVIRGVSARKMVAWYEDPAEDDWPLYAIRGESMRKPNGSSMWRFRLYDDEAIYTFDWDDNQLTYLTADEHGAGVCPVVRYTNMLDLDGRSSGEVEPLIPLSARIDQDTFDRLVVQRFGSWKVRTITGMSPPDLSTDSDTDGRVASAAQQLKVSDLLIAESPDARFGTLDETPLDGYIRARDADIKDLAAVSQTPPHHLLGQMANLSAEALAAAEASLTRKVEERKHTFGESHEQVLRLAAAIRGDRDGAQDFEAQVKWRDMESRSLAQAADALGKMAQMLNVPVQMLWEKIPGWTQQDVERARSMQDESDPIAGLLSDLERQNAPSIADEIKDKADALGVLIRAGVSPESAAAQVGLTGIEFTGAVPVALRLPEREAAALEE